MFPTKVVASISMFLYPLQTMKQKLWITLITYLAYCIDKELYKAIDYLKTQVEVLLEQQEKQNKRILLTNKQRMRIAAKAKRLTRKMLKDCTLLFTVDILLKPKGGERAETARAYADLISIGPVSCKSLTN